MPRQDIIAGPQNGSRGGGPGLADRMRWRGEWNGGPLYEEHDTVRDGSWTMVCINPDGTYDRPAPQPVGEPVRGYDTDEDPGFASESEALVPQWVVVQRYTAPDDTKGWVLNLRYWSDSDTGTKLYRVYAVIDPLGATPTSSLIGTFRPASIGWQLVSLGEGVIAPGTQFDIAVLADETGVGSSTFSGTWQYKTGNSNPGEGEIYHRSNQRQMRINVTDKGDNDREAELATLKPGDTIALGGITYTITVVIGFTGSGSSRRLHVDVEPETWAQEDEYTVLYTVFDEGSITYPRIDDYYVSGNVGGFEGESYADAIAGGENDHGYGVDILFQPAEVSDDWDMVAYSSIGGGGGGTAPSTPDGDALLDSARLDGYYRITDFDQVALDNNDPWRGYAINGGSAAAGVAGDTYGHPGVCQFRSHGSNANSGYSFHTLNNVWSNNGIEGSIFEAMFEMVVVAGYTAYVGFHNKNNNASEPTTGFYFEISGTSVTAVNANNGTRTKAVMSGVTLAAGGRYRVRAKRDIGANQSVLSVWDASTDTLLDSVTESANMPVANNRFGHGAKTFKASGDGAAPITFDYLMIFYKATRD